MSNIFLVKFIKTDHYQPKIFEPLIKSKFNIDVGRKRIVEILKSNRYKCKYHN